MKSFSVIVALSSIVFASTAHADVLCAPLRGFVKSVRPNETKEFIFHTSWGGNFRDSPEEVIYAKRCIHNNYAPAHKVCDYLMESGAVEFAGNNIKRAVMSLSPQTRFSPRFELHRASFSFSVGSDSRGSNVEMEFYEDTELGGMAFKVVANGY